MNIIFDLDGTITDSSEGVFYTFRKVFDLYGLPQLSDDKLRSYIGPPTEETFGRYLPEEEVTRAVKRYRKIYKEQGGIKKNEMYPEMDMLLLYLRSKNHKLYVATTKEVESAIKILQIFDIYECFHGVYGADSKKGILTKTDVLESLFASTKAEKEQSILIGDTIYDVLGAEDVNIKVAVVLYGFGRKESFEGKNIEFFVDSVEELFDKF